MPTTTNFGWTTPADTDLVKDGASAIRTLGNGVDTSLVDLKGGTTGQILSKASGTDLDYTWVTPNVGDITEVQAGTGISVASGTGPIPVVATKFHGVSVYNSTGATISNATLTILNFDSEWFDTDAFHSTVSNTSRLTVPSGFGGYYRVEAKLFFASNGTGSRIARILKNGTLVDASYFEHGAYSNGKNILHPYVILNLAATDYVQVEVYQDSGGNLATENSLYSAFNMEYLGAA